MAKNFILDVKPKMEVAVDIAPSLKSARDIKPMLSQSLGYDQINPNVIELRRGQPIGLLLSLTYNETTDLTERSVKPLMSQVINRKGNLIKPFGETVIYYDPFTLLTGQPIGLLLSLTYSETTSGTRARD